MASAPTDGEQADPVPYPDDNWLYSRMLAPEARALFAEIGLRPGMRVLDAGSGGAAYSFYLAEAVAPGGYVLAVDSAAAPLAYARRRAAEMPLPASRINFARADIFALPPESGQFDVIWFSGWLGRSATTLDRLRLLLARHLKPGGIVAVRGTWDHLREYNPSYIPHGLGPEPGLMDRLNYARTQVQLAGAFQPARDENMQSLPYNAPGLLVRADLEDPRLLPLVVVRQQPLSEDDRLGIASRFRWTRESYAELGIKKYISAADWERYLQLTDPDHPDYLLDQPDFVFFAAGLVAVGRKPTGEFDGATQVGAANSPGGKS